MADRDEGEERNTSGPLYGDPLEAIVSRMPLIDLLPAYHVSRDWRRDVRLSAMNPSRLKPWLVVHIQSLHNPLLVVTRAFDPESHVWTNFPCGNIPPITCLPLKASHSHLLYTISSKLNFSLDALKTTWHEVDGPKVTRLDPVVAVIGRDIVVAGGCYDFEDNPLAVEIYNCESKKWELCQSLPDVLEGSPATTWLSVAVSDDKMFLLEKSSGTLCIFNPKANAWEDTFHLRPNASSYFSLIGFSNNQLYLIGLIGDTENVESLRIWEVNYGTFYCTEVGTMPSSLLRELMESCSSPSSISISMISGRVYIYSLPCPKEIFFCELVTGGSTSCSWRRLQSSVINDINEMHRFTLTSSNVRITDLQKAFGSGYRR